MRIREKKKKNSRAGLEALAFWAVQRTMHYEGGNGKWGSENIPDPEPEDRSDCTESSPIQKMFEIAFALFVQEARHACYSDFGALYIYEW